MMKPLLFALASCLTATGTAFAQSQPSAGSNPTVELTLGFDGPVHRAAQFPGIALAGAFLLPRGDRLGFGVVGEIDAAYLRPSQAIGARVYGRSGSLSSGKQATYFLQLLLGGTSSVDEGIYHSNHARLVQPGAGIAYGGPRKALHIQVDYHHLADPVITKTGKIGEPATTETLPNYRFMFGFTWRLRAR
jgi:hypothetical protein